MKIFLVCFAVLALVLRVQALPHRSSEESNERRNENDNDNTNGSWDPVVRIADALKRQRASWQLDESSAERINKAESFSAIEPYLLKLKQRLNNSDELSSTPELRKTLTDIGRLKLLTCASNNDWKLWRNDEDENNFDRGCLGRAIGQVMQLVANIERMSGNPSQLSGSDRGQY